MAALPPVPPVADLDRYVTFSLVSDQTFINVPFPVYGGDEDLAVTVNGQLLSSASWALQSASGTPLAQLSLPITDGQIMFSPPVTAGSIVEIIGNFQPRQISMPTAPGLGRREFNQTIGTLMSCLREMKRQLGSGTLPVAMAPNATGTLANRSAYDGAATGFTYLQTDDAAGRPIFFVKNSATVGDWSQALIVQVNAANGYPVEGRGGYSSTPVSLTGTVAGTVIIPSMLTIASGAFSAPPRSLRVRLLGTYQGSPSLAIENVTAGVALSTLSFPANGGAALPFDAEFTIDAVTSASQIANAAARCQVTPFYTATLNAAAASNFATGTPQVIGLLAQLSNVGNTLVIDRWEAWTV